MKVSNIRGPRFGYSRGQNYKQNMEKLLTWFPRMGDVGAAMLSEPADCSRSRFCKCCWMFCCCCCSACCKAWNRKSWFATSSATLDNFILLKGAVVVVKWSACLHSTLTIRVWILLNSSVFEKNENKEKEAVIGPFKNTSTGAFLIWLTMFRSTKTAYSYPPKLIIWCRKFG